MNLCASLVVRNELGRYLEPCVKHLLAFCDTVVVLDDGSDDGTDVFLADAWHTRRFHFVMQAESTFFKHEGRTRQRLLDLTLRVKPTHVLNLDADEFVSDGAALRARIEADPSVSIWSLDIEEVWNADETLHVREDGGWRSHPLPVLWRVDPSVNYRIMDRRLACRRVPTAILRSPARAVPTGVDLLHFGWTDRSERAARLARYRKHDRGRFHANAHLDSIEWADDDPRLQLRDRPWPEGSVFDGLRERFAAPRPFHELLDDDDLAVMAEDHDW